MSESTKKNNPDIKSIEVGVREVREIKIYPLSMADQSVLTEDIAKLIVETADKFSGDERETDEQAIFFMRDLIVDNLERLLKYITIEEERPTLSELTNNQFYKIVDIVFSVNYEGLIKNFKDLFTRIQNAGTLPEMKKATKEV